jgi:predicted RNA-binding protein with PIN domain
MSQQFLIDGYNVIKAIPRLADLTLEEGRAALVRFIREYLARQEVTIFFDGQEGICSMELSTAPRLVFSRGCSADDLMREYVEAAPRPGDIICVTDDRELALACRHRGARIQGVREFMARGERPSPSGRSGTAPEDSKSVPYSAARRIDEELARRWLQRPKPP